MRPKKTSITTLAEATGLSVATVSRALAGSPQVTAPTRERVLQAAHQMHYVRDQAAVRLKTGKTHALAFVMDHQDAVQPGFQDFLWGLSAALRGTDYHLVVLPQSTDRQALEAVRFAMDKGMCDGFVLSYTSAQDPRVRHLQAAQMPFITYGRTRLPAHDWIDFDNDTFSALAVAALAARGRQRLGIMLPAATASFCAHLRRGFLRACKAHGVQGTCLEAVSLDDAPGSIYDWGLRCLRDFDALVVTREAPLLPLLGAIEALGLVCGTDVDVVIKHSSALPRYIHQPLIACFEDMHLAGHRLATAMMARLANPAMKPQHLLFPPPELEYLHDPRRPQPALA